MLSKTNIKLLKTYHIVKYLRLTFYSFLVTWLLVISLNFKAYNIVQTIKIYNQIFQYMIDEILCILHVLEHGFMYVSVCIITWYIHEVQCIPQMIVILLF